MASKADMYLMSYNEYFPAERMLEIQDRLGKLTDEQFNYLHTAKLHNPTTILIMSIILGELGVDRFMLGDIGLGIGKLLTLGGCGIWWIIDMFLVRDRARTKNYETLIGMLNYLDAQGGGMGGYGQQHQ
ncbi:MAG: TM2 domain-containing protein [Defluviitaleaceae bacterium]|nr:TM2 domain-containing protein [Defluviitaleaceae bacterium]